MEGDDDRVVCLMVAKSEVEFIIQIMRLLNYSNNCALKLGGLNFVTV